MKHYIEIQRLRTQDVVVDDTLTLEKNTDADVYKRQILWLQVLEPIRLLSVKYCNN